MAEVLFRISDTPHVSLRSRPPLLHRPSHRCFAGGGHMSQHIVVRWADRCGTEHLMGACGQENGFSDMTCVGFMFSSCQSSSIQTLQGLLEKAHEVGVSYRDLATTPQKPLQQRVYTFSCFPLKRARLNLMNMCSATTLSLRLSVAKCSLQMALRLLQRRAADGAPSSAAQHHVCIRV